MTQEQVLELTEEQVAAECAAGVARVRAGLLGDGAADCIVCGDPIEEARRAAMSSAIRCVECQERHERSQRGL